MTALKIAAIAGSMIIAAGGSAAVATRDKWWAKTSISEEKRDDSTEEVRNNPDSRGDNDLGDGAEEDRGQNGQQPKESVDTV